MSSIRVVTCAAVLSLLASAGCGQAIDSAQQAIADLSSDATTSTTVPAPSVANAMVELGVCSDPTTSVEDLAPGLAASVSPALVSALEGRLRAIDQPGANGGPAAMPAVRIRLTTVASNSYLGRPLVDAAIPGVAPLAPIEVNGDADAAAAQELDALAHTRQVDSARRETAAVVATLSQTIIPPAPTSDPSGCLALLAELAPAPSAVRRVLLYVGDLEQIGPERWPETFAGTEVVVVQVCAAPVVCADTHRWLTENVTSRGGHVGAPARPEDLITVITAAMEVGQ